MLIGIDANEANLTLQRVGINQYAFDLLSALYQTPASHSFVIYLKTPPRTDLPLPRSGWNYRILPFPKLWTQTRLPFDLFVHQPRPDVFLSLTHYAPRWSPIPTVVCVMDLGFHYFPKQFTPRDIQQLHRWTSYSVSQAKKIITISEFSKNDIAKIYHIAPKNISVVYPGFDTSQFHPQINSPIFQKYQLGKKYVLFLSSLKPSKNVANVIAAFNMVNDPHLQLVITGKKAWMYNEIFSEVKASPLSKQIIFTDYIPETDVPNLISAARALLMPSFYEGFGLPVLEAMACGTPVVVSRAASLPEVAGEAGIYVDPYSPSSIAAGIKVSLSQERRKYIKFGLRQAIKFDWTKAVSQTLSTLESAV